MEENQENISGEIPEKNDAEIAVNEENLQEKEQAEQEPVVLEKEPVKKAPFDYAPLIKDMMERQLKNRDISDSRVLEAMSKVPRHLFVPEYLARYSYADGPMSIGHGQTISQPYIVAAMTQSLSLKPGDRVLEIGTGSGYQTAVLSQLVNEVYSIEIIKELSDKAGKLLANMGFTNIKLKTVDGYAGFSECAPYDAIIVTCAPPNVPPALIEQLAEGGRMVIPVGEGVQRLKLFIKENGEIRENDLMGVAFVPMTGVGMYGRAVSPAAEPTPAPAEENTADAAAEKEPENLPGKNDETPVDNEESSSAIAAQEVSVASEPETSPEEVLPESNPETVNNI